MNAGGRACSSPGRAGALDVHLRPVLSASGLQALPNKEEITGLFDLWNGALATLSSSKVQELYAKDAVLLPTVSNKVRGRAVPPRWVGVVVERGEEG
jgi:hypothetical protein